MQHEIKNNHQLGNHSDIALHCRTSSRPILPLTPYERWQHEKYGEFYFEKNHDEIESDMGEMSWMQKNLYYHN